MIAGLLSGGLCRGQESEHRLWTDVAGQHRVEARFLRLSGEGNRIWLERRDGEQFLVALSDLSPDDRAYVRGQVRAAVQKAAETVAARLEASPYGEGREIARLENEKIAESSGLAVSRREAGLFWTHNDSGDAARLYAFDLQGRDRGTILLEGVLAFDWEDMASWTRGGKPCLLVGDVGNNGLGAAVHMLYVVEEPPLGQTPAAEPLVVKPLQTIYFSYEDDHYNCEALAIDPTSQTVLLATKQAGLECNVFSLPLPPEGQPGVRRQQDAAGNNQERALVAHKIATLAIPSATAMDISPDGLRAVIGTYGDAYLYTRTADESWDAAFARKPLVVRLPERIQGESIAFGADGRSLYLTSEKRPTPLVELRPCDAGR